MTCYYLLLLLKCADYVDAITRTGRRRCHDDKRFDDDNAEMTVRVILMVCDGVIVP